MTNLERFVLLLLASTAAIAVSADEEGSPSSEERHDGGGGLGGLHFPLTYSYGPRNVQPSFGFQRRRSGGPLPPEFVHRPNYGYNATKPHARPPYSDLAEEIPYSYEYNVKDDYEGAHFGHKESGEGSNTNGQYFVRLPDGRVQTVTYYTDKEGFHSDVAYAGNAGPLVSEQDGSSKAPPSLYSGPEVSGPKVYAPVLPAPVIPKLPPPGPPVPVYPYKAPELRIPYLPDTTFIKGVHGPTPGKSLVAIPPLAPRYVPSIPGLALYASVKPYGSPQPPSYLGGSFNPDSIYTEEESEGSGDSSEEEVTSAEETSAGYSPYSPDRGVTGQFKNTGLNLEITNPHTNETLLVSLDDLDKAILNEIKLNPKAHHHEDEGDIPLPSFDITETLFRNEINLASFKSKPKRSY